MRFSEVKIQDFCQPIPNNLAWNRNMGLHHGISDWVYPKIAYFGRGKWSQATPLSNLSPGCCQRRSPGGSGRSNGKPQWCLGLKPCKNSWHPPLVGGTNGWMYQFKSIVFASAGSWCGVDVHPQKKHGKMHRGTLSHPKIKSQFSLNSWGVLFTGWCHKNFLLGAANGGRINLEQEFAALGTSNRF